MWAGFSAFEVKDGQLVTTTGKTYYLVPDELYHVRIEFDPSKPMMETYVDGVACSTAGTEDADISLGDEGVIRSMASGSIGRIIFVADKTAALTEDIDPASVWCWYDNLTITYPAPSFNFPTVNSDNTVNAGISEFPFYCTRALDSTTLKNITVSKNGTELMYGDDFEVTFDGDGYYISNTKLILKTATQNRDKYIVTFKNVKDFLPFGQTTYTADQKIEFNAVSKLFVNCFTERTGLVIDNESAVISGVIYGDNAQSFINNAIVNEGITVSIADNDGNDVEVTENTVITENLKLRLSKDGAYFDYSFVFKDALLNYTFTGATADNHLDNTQRAAWKIAGVLPNAAYGLVTFYDYGKTATDKVYESGRFRRTAKGEDGAKLFVDLLYEKTGIKVKRIVPPLGQEEQQFNIMIASGEMTDIITWSWGNFLGGADKAVTDGYIISLNDLMSDYTPNFKKLLESDPELDKMVKSDNGNYCYFPGMNQKGDAAPFSMAASDSSYGLLGLAGAYGITLDFYKDDNGKIQFGYVQPQCKDFLAMMNKWYSEGLLDKNISNVDGKTLDSCLLNGKTGAVFGWLGGGMGKWLTAAKSLGMESFDLVGVPAPVLNRGDRVKYASKEMPVAVTGQAISSQTKHKELAAKFLD